MVALLHKVPMIPLFNAADGQNGSRGSGQCQFSVNLSYQCRSFPVNENIQKQNHTIRFHFNGKLSIGSQTVDKHEEVLQSHVATPQMCHPHNMSKAISSNYSIMMLLQTGDKELPIAIPYFCQ